MNKDIAAIDGRFQQESAAEKSALTADVTHANADAEVIETSDMKVLRLEHFDGALYHGEDQSIISFLSRPQIIAAGNLAAAGVWPSLIYSGYFPRAFLNIPLVADKIKGVFGIKCDFVFTLAVNAQRFQQGRYVLAWVPLGGAARPGNDTRFLVSHYASRTQLTTLPHVEIDINCQTEVTLKVPFVHCWPYAPTTEINNLSYQTGFLIFAPYSAIKAGPSTYNCDYVLSVRAENISLAGPIVPQSGRALGRISRTVEDQEKKSAGVGPVETTLKVAADVAGYLKRVPVLSSIAEPAQWWLDLSANVANAFGWSKPHNSEHTHAMYKNNMYALTNIDTVDNSEVMGYTDKNTVEVLPGFSGSDIDELSIRYLSGISAWYQTLLWNTTDPENTLLHQRDLQPKNFFSNSTYGVNTTFNLVPMAFVASFFAYYKGSIKITFKFVKTEFHSGRLVLTFTPRNTAMNSAAPVTFANTAYNFREIIDIRKGSVFTYVMPYTAFQQYTTSIGNNSYYGVFSLRVLNELRAPDTCAQNIDILVEASAHDDMEFMMPATVRGSYTAVPTAQSGNRKLRMDDMPECNEVAVIMGNAKIFDSDWAARACVGEKIVSLRQILKRFSLLDKRVAGTPGANQFYVFGPHTFPINSITGTTLTNANVIPDNLTWITSCFAMYRGGVRYKFVNDRPITDAAYWAVNSYYRSQDIVPEAFFLDFRTTPDGLNNIRETSNNSVVIERQDSRGGIEVQFPFYSPVPAACVQDSQQSPISPLFVLGTTPSTSAYIVNFGTAVTTDYRTYRAAADDYDLGMFVSIPPISGWGFIGGS